MKITRFSAPVPRLLRLVPFSFVLIGAIAVAAADEVAEIPTPSRFLGMRIGADRVVADYRQIKAYFSDLDARSPRVSVVSLGQTTLGEEMIMAVISSEANIGALPRLKEIARKLSDPRGRSDAEIESLASEGKAFLLITCNIHSTEIAASQMAMEWAHSLATSRDAETMRRLSEVVLLLVPSLNPDGQIMETEWYRKHLGTKLEGGRMPWLYHHYVGHDNNRDWFMLTQKESKALSRAVYHEWFPQIWLDEHQMGSTGPRIFVPPYAEPVDPDIHPLVWRETNLIGSLMALRLEQAGKSGVIYGYSYDAYWPGGTKNTAWFKNITGLLTELASVRIASPLYIEPTELSGGRKGLIEYEPQTNFPNPWPGGWWRLRDIMDYERIISDAILEASANHRVDILRDMAARAKASIAAARPGEGFRLPRDQRDWATALVLADLLAEHNVEVLAGENGDLWVPLGQPYGKFVSEMLGPQRYPEVKLVPGPEIVRPYDVAAWSLPLMMGVRVERGVLPSGLGPYVASPSTSSGASGAPAGQSALVPGGPETFKAVNVALRSKGGKVAILPEPESVGGKTWPAGTFVLDPNAAKAALESLRPGLVLAPIAERPSKEVRIQAPRVGLYKPWAASMDEGWTRFILEQYGFGPQTLDNATIKKGGLRGRYDAIVLPDVAKETIATGKPKREEGEMTYQAELPPEYTGGLEAEGAKALKEFVEGGGTIVALASSGDYLIEQFNIPVLNVLAKAKPEEFSCPGSILRARTVPGHPVTFGLPEDAALFVSSPIAFKTVPPGSEIQRWVLASYPDDPRDILLSGWIHGEKKLVRQAAAVALRYGKGKLVLLGFRPQNRAQTNATFPFLFNALYWSALP